MVLPDAGRTGITAMIRSAYSCARYCSTDSVRSVIPAQAGIQGQSISVDCAMCPGGATELASRLRGNDGAWVPGWRSLARPARPLLLAHHGQLRSEHGGHAFEPHGAVARHRAGGAGDLAHDGQRRGARLFIVRQQQRQVAHGRFFVHLQHQVLLAQDGLEVGDAHFLVVRCTQAQLADGGKRPFVGGAHFRTAVDVQQATDDGLGRAALRRLAHGCQAVGVQRGFARQVAADAARGAAVGAQAHQRLQYGRAVHIEEEFFGRLVARVAIHVEHGDDLFRHRFLHLQENIVLGDRPAVGPDFFCQRRDAVEQLVLARERRVAQAQRVRIAQLFGALFRHQAFHDGAGKLAIQALVNFRQPRHGGKAALVFHVVAAQLAQRLQVAALEAHHEIAAEHVAGGQFLLQHFLVFFQEHRFVQAGRHDVDHVHGGREFLVLLVGHRGGNEDAQVTDTLVHRVNDGLAAGHQRFVVFVQVQHPAQRLLRWRDVVAPRAEHDDRRLDVAQVDAVAVAVEQRSFAQLVTDKQRVSDVLHFARIEQHRVAPPFFKFQEARRLGVDLGIDVVVLGPQRVGRVHFFKIGDQLGAVEDAMAEVARQRGHPGATERATEVAQRVLAAHASPVRQRRAGQDQRPHQVGFQGGGHHDLPAGLAVADQGRLAVRLRVALGHVGNKSRFRAAHVFDGLARHGIRGETDEVARVAGLEHDADFAVVLHAADAGAVAGARVEHDERTLAGVGRHAVGRSDVTQAVVHGALERGAVHDDLERETQYVRRGLGGARIAFIAALPQDIEKQDRALTGVDPVIEALLGQCKRVARPIGQTGPGVLFITHRNPPCMVMLPCTKVLQCAGKGKRIRIMESRRTPALIHERMMCINIKKAARRRLLKPGSELRFARCFLALVLFQVALAQTDRFRGDFHQFVVVDEFDSVFQRHLDRRHQAHGFVGTRRTHVGQLLALDRVHDQVVVARVDADDHAFVHRVVVDHEHAAAILQFPDSVGHGSAVVLRDQHAVATAAQLTFRGVDWCVRIEHVAHQAGTTGQGHEFALEADQATCWNTVFQTHTAFAVRFHVLQVATTTAQLFHDAALVGFFHVNRQLLVRLMAHAIDHLEHHARTRNGHLETFATHVFDQDGQVQLAAARDFERGVVFGRRHAQCHVGFQFLVQTVAQLTRGHELAFAASQRRVVDHEVHGQGRLVDGQHRQRFRGVRCAHGRTDADFFDTVDQHDVAGNSVVHQHALEALEVQHLVDAALDRGSAWAVQDDDVLAGFHAAAVDTADTDFTHVRRVVERGDLHLQRTVRIVVTHWYVLQDGVEQRLHVAAAHVFGQAGVAVQTRSVNNREVQLFVGRAQLVEQFESLVDRPFRTCTWTVDLVDHDDRLQAQGQCLAGHKAGLWHRAFLGIDQQQNRVNHRQHAFHFAAEVGVAWGVNDVDVGAFVLDCAILGQNRDAALFFEVVRVHDTGIDRLVFAEGAGLAEQLVNQGGFTVVNVGDDCNVANCAFSSGHSRIFAEKLRVRTISCTESRLV
uniref:Uncharacterized protein n=1 Tax=Tanacetum cinerariifolium TaxID=118510 RepID=A0A699GGX3_TANCI|nr:hypothetical protein [Tanacetum cinerariifolium]